jgi:acetyl esterase/lipase
VLLAPTTAPHAEFGRVPPTFLQSSPQSPTLSVSRSLEIDLREAGVAVRPVEYADLPDAWVRYPRFAGGSKRAVQDVLAFLRRGFGMDGTFSGVIPGWDLR